MSTRKSKPGQEPIIVKTMALVDTNTSRSILGKHTLATTDVKGQPPMTKRKQKQRIVKRQTIDAGSVLDGFVSYLPGRGLGKIKEICCGVVKCIEWDSEHLERPTLSFLGKTYKLPRDDCIINLNPVQGQPASSYQYGKRKIPAIIPYDINGLRLVAELLVTQANLTRTTGDPYPPFNGVVVNRYRDGSDSVSWHSDNEVTLDPAGAIVSLSIGASRAFQFRQRRATSGGHQLTLHDGDVVIMHRGCQESFQHQLPKTRKPVGERFNLTFRTFKEKKTPTLPV
jgi:hypothetical protein